MKYFSAPGWKKSQCVYNLDAAREWPLAVLCEGVTDVWRVGEPGICIFGKSLSESQLDQIVGNFESVAVLLDPDAYILGKHNSVSDGRKTMHKLAARMSSVFKVDLPGNRDPADCTVQVVWDRIEAAANAHGIKGVRPD